MFFRKNQFKLYNLKRLEMAHINSVFLICHLIVWRRDSVILYLTQLAALITATLVFLPNFLLFKTDIWPAGVGSHNIRNLMCKKKAAWALATISFFMVCFRTKIKLVDLKTAG